MVEEHKDMELAPVEVPKMGTPIWSEFRESGKSLLLIFMTVSLTIPQFLR